MQAQMVGFQDSFVRGLPDRRFLGRLRRSAFRITSKSGPRSAHTANRYRSGHYTHGRAGCRERKLTVDRHGKSRVACRRTRMRENRNRLGLLTAPCASDRDGERRRTRQRRARIRGGCRSSMAGDHTRNSRLGVPMKFIGRSARRRSTSTRIFGRSFIVSSRSTARRPSQRASSAHGDRVEVAYAGAIHRGTRSRPGDPQAYVVVSGIDFSHCSSAGRRRI